MYTENQDWERARLSGVGFCGSNNARHPPKAPVDPDGRYDDHDLDPESHITINLRPHAMLRVEFLNNTPWGFGFHSSCWTLLDTVCQPRLHDVFSACLSVPRTIGSMLGREHDYAGIALTMVLGSPSEQRPWIERRAFQWYDPVVIPGIRSALYFATVLGPRDEDDRFQPPPRNNAAADCFNALPLDILSLVLACLPSRDVAPLKLASRTFASMPLPGTFWASRFSEGHEYHHVFEVHDRTRPKPRSWKAMYEAVAPLETQLGMANRKRIWGLAMQLRGLLEKVRGPCHGCPLPDVFPRSNSQGNGDDDSGWRLVSHDFHNKHPNPTTIGCKPLNVREVEVPLDIKGLFISFVQLANERFVSGIRFEQANGEEVRIGYTHPNREVSIDIPDETHLRGWHVAFHSQGVQAVAALMSDGSVSSWAGERKGRVMWRLDGKTPRVTALRAEFDVSTCLSPSERHPHTWTNPHLSSGMETRVSGCSQAAATETHSSGHGLLGLGDPIRAIHLRKHRGARIYNPRCNTCGHLRRHK